MSVFIREESIGGVVVEEVGPRGGGVGGIGSVELAHYLNMSFNVQGTQNQKSSMFCGIRL